jgi:hypothetical protein
MNVMSSTDTAIAVKPTNSCEPAGAQPLLGGTPQIAGDSGRVIAPSADSSRDRG